MKKDKDSKVNVTSFNQSGGITANEVNIGSLPRRISTESQQLFINEIKKHPSLRNAITIRTYLGDSECHTLSHDIKNSFEKAGWKINAHTFEIPKQPIRKVILGIPNSEKESNSALVIYNWLNLNNLNVIAELVPDEKGYIIFVGQNI